MPPIEPLCAVRSFTACVQSVHTFNPAMRLLSNAEVQVLEANGCTCENNWACVYVLQPKNKVDNWTALSLPRLKRSHFRGTVMLGKFEVINSGIFDSTITDSIIHDNVFISRCSQLERCVVMPKAVLKDCTTIICSGETTHFGNYDLPFQ